MIQQSAQFSSTKLIYCVQFLTAVGYLVTFGTGLLGGFLFQNFIEDSSFPSKFSLFCLYVYLKLHMTFAAKNQSEITLLILSLTKVRLPTSNPS